MRKDNVLKGLFLLVFCLVSLGIFNIKSNTNIKEVIAYSEEYEAAFYEILDIDEERPNEFEYWESYITYDDFTATSSDTSIFTIDENGNIKGVGKGIALLQMKWTCESSYLSCGSSVPVIVGLTDQELLDELINKTNRTQYTIYYDSQNEELTDQLIKERLEYNIRSDIMGSLAWNLDIYASVTLKGNNTYECVFVKGDTVSSNKITGTYDLYNQRDHWSLYFDYEGIFTLESNETKKIPFNIYPSDMVLQSNPFTSHDENIFTVDKDGNITGHNKGISYITSQDASNGYSERAVAVGLTDEELLQEVFNTISINNYYISYDSNNGDFDLEGRLKGIVKSYACIHNSCLAVDVNVNVINDTLFKFSLTKDGFTTDERIGSYYLHDIRREWQISSLGISTGNLINIGDVKALNYQTYPSDIAFEKNPFRSSDESVAIVDDDYNVHGVSKGYAKISGISPVSESSFVVYVGYESKEEFITEIFDQINFDFPVQYGSERDIINEIKNNIHNQLYALNLDYSYYSFTNYKVQLKNNNKYTFVFDDGEVSSDIFVGSYELKGISVKSDEIHLTKGEVYNSNLSFTEGDNYNLVISLLNDDETISITQDGQITALKAGYECVVITDAYGQFYNSIDVYVDEVAGSEFDELSEFFEDYFDNNTVDIVFDKSNYYPSQGAYGGLHNYGITNNVANEMQKIVTEAGLKSLYYRGSPVYYCSFDLSKCSLEYTEYTEEESRIVFSIDFDINLKGILNKSEVAFISEDDTFKSDLVVFEEGSVSGTSLNPDICSISKSLTITGLDTGVCAIKYTVGNYETIQYVMVNHVEFSSRYNDILDDVDTNVSIPIINPLNNKMFTEYDLEDLVLEYAVKNVTKFFENSRTISHGMGNYYLLNDHEVLNFYGNFSFNSDYTSLELHPFYEYCFKVSESDWYDQYGSNDCMWWELSSIKPITFNITYTDVSEDIVNLSESIHDAFSVKFYNYWGWDGLYLINSDANQSEAYNNFYSYLEQTNFIDDLHKVCADCDVIPWNGGGGTTDGDVGYFSEGRTVLIVKDDVPVTTLFINLRFYDEKYKDLVLRKKLEPGYTYSVTDIEVDKESFGVLINEEETITATVVPSNATYKELTWSSDDEGIAVVDQNGKVRGISAGSTTIRVRSHDTLTEKTITVAVPEVDPQGPDEPDEGIPVYRMFNPINGEHLYTTDAYEVEVIYTTQGWGKEGIGWYSSATGTPVYRLYNPVLGNHLYTSDTYEISIITTTQGWVLDFDGAPVMYSSGEVPIYRLFNPGLQGQHHLTTDFNEYNVIPVWGWAQEGIAMNAVKVGVPETTHYFNR